MAIRNSLVVGRIFVAIQISTGWQLTATVVGNSSTPTREEFPRIRKRNPWGWCRYLACIVVYIVAGGTVILVIGIGIFIGRGGSICRRRSMTLSQSQRRGERRDGGG